MGKEKIIKAWFENFGIDKIASDLEVTQHAVRIWIRGDGAPLYPKMKRVVQLAKNTFSIDELYNFSTRNK